MINKARKHIQEGLLDAGISAYRAALKEQPNNANWIAEYAHVLWSIYQIKEAKAQFKKLTSIALISPDPLLQAAKLLFDNHSYESACELLALAHSMRPDDDDILVMYAGALERHGEKDKAWELAQRALTCSPENSRAARLLAHIERGREQYEPAVDRLNHHLKQFPSDQDWRLRYELAAILDRLGEYDAAYTQLCVAKEQLQPTSKVALQQSYAIRQRQWELTRNITPHDLKQWHQPTTPGLRPITLMGGFPRSGTSLLESILNSHESCIGTDESGILTQQFVSPIIHSAPNSREALEELRSFDGEQLEAGRDSYWHFTEAWLGETIGARTLIEKDPLITADLPLSLRLFPSSKILMPLRDPRDVILSYFFTLVPLNWNSAASTSLIESAQFYADCMRHWLYLRDKISHDSMEVKYEELIRTPSEHSIKLCKFLNIEQQSNLAESSKRTTQSTISTPTYQDVTKPLYTRSINRWRNYEKQLEPVLEILSPYLKAFGYPS